MMHSTRRIPIVQLNDFLTCKLCKGYYIDATTIIECLHTFCRSCIVQYLEKNKYCPVCDVQVHKSKPLHNIRPDKTIQDIVYKLVPRLFKNEMCKRRQFYSLHPEARPSNLEQCGEASYQHILSADETICLTLNYCDSTGSPRYLRCPAALSIVHLKKLLRNKYGLPDHYQVDIFHNQDCLSPHLTLIDIAYIYLWKRKGPLEFTYRIYENVSTSPKVDVSSPIAADIPQSDADKQKSTSPSNSDPEQNNRGTTSWKEVQLRISESGEMCFTNVDSTAILNQEVTKSNSTDASESSESLPNSKNIELKTEKRHENLSDKPDYDNGTIVNQEEFSELNKIPESTTSTNVDCDNKTSTTENCISTTTSTATTTTTTTSSSETNTTCTPSVTSPLPLNSVKPTVTVKSTDTELLFNGKHKTSRNVEDEPLAKQPKQTILNHTLNFGIHHHLSSDHPLKRNSQIRKSVENTTSFLDTSMESQPVSKTTTRNFVNSTQCSSVHPKPTIINKESNNISSSGSGVTVIPQWSQNKMPPTKLPCYSPKLIQNPVITVPKVQTTSTILKSKVPITPIMNHKMTSKTKPSNSIGYKTLREPPKTWNPQIPRSLLLKGTDQKDTDVKNPRPAKFFKMRNNMPRYLGNPASGVKPLYQVHNTSENDKCEEVTVKPEKTEIKKHSIVKIDPKTLKPISEKAPESTSLSNQSELKINTSSVPIFSPVKLQQSSPKSDRRSPKSPQSPKTKTSPSSKRDKLSLNYLPPNPFIPNLASPTLSPNQFLYPPGFPTYDHRLVAAYHNLLFGQRFPFATTHPVPSLNFELCQRKVFDSASQVPPTTAPLSLSNKEKCEPRKTNSENTKISASSETNTQELNNAASQPSSRLKKKMSKNSPKNEKSLENTVEKLTQNRVSELKKTDANSVLGKKEESAIIESLVVSTEPKGDKVNCKTDEDDVDSTHISNNCKNTEDLRKCNELKKTEPETRQTDTQSIQNGDKTVSNNNTIESVVSFENINKV